MDKISIAARKSVLCLAACTDSSSVRCSEAGGQRRLKRKDLQAGDHFKMADVAGSDGVVEMHSRDADQQIGG